jgi:hypothetical protein
MRASRCGLSVIILLGIHGAALGQEDEGSGKYFHYLHYGHLAAEQICKLLYGDSRPTVREQTRAKAICATVQHPLSWLMKHEPKWWKDNEPAILKSLEDKARHNEAESQALSWCNQDPAKCYGMWLPSLFPKYCSSKPHAPGWGCNDICPMVGVGCGTIMRDCYPSPEYCNANPDDRDCIVSHGGTASPKSPPNKVPPPPPPTSPPS